MPSISRSSSYGSIPPLPLGGVGDPRVQKIVGKRLGHTPTPPELRRAVTYHGAGVSYTPSSTTIDPAVQGICNFLLAQHPGAPASDLMGVKNFQRVVLGKDRAVLTEFRKELEYALEQGIGTDEKIFIPFIYNVLALLPFTYPSEGDKFKIPVKHKGKWIMATYIVEKKFAMSPEWFSSPVPVLGLVPRTNRPNAHPILSCMGTTYPAGDGFMASVLSDFTPGFSVGHAATLYGKEELGKWLKGKRNVEVTGCSLGGAIALHTARLFPRNIKEVYAFNPAGQYAWNWKGAKHGQTNFHIYSQENDLVSTMGFFPEGRNVEYHRVFAEAEEASFFAHAKAYSAAPNVTFVKSSAKYENQRGERKVLTVLHMIFGPLIFLALLPVKLLHRLSELFCHPAKPHTD